jgi:hypothetical protein
MRANRHHLLGFLALSAVLHLLFLAIEMSPKTSSAGARTPLSVQISRVDPPPRPPAAATADKAETVSRLSRPPSAAKAPDAVIGLPVQDQTMPAIDIDAARATARSYAREPRPHLPFEPTQKVLTVETAIARATAPDVVVETRGTAGEYVTQSRHSRCVTPLVVPYFMAGKTMLTLCEVRKG